MFFAFVVIGAVGGLIGGMGMGGGTLLIPLLTIFCGVNQHVAQAVNLITFIPMAIVALIVHYKKGLIKKDGIFPIILTGIIFSVLGTFLARSINGETLKRIFGIFLIILSCTRFISALKDK